jgi:hypothetical protein
LSVIYQDSFLGKCIVVVYAKEIKPQVRNQGKFVMVYPEKWKNKDHASSQTHNAPEKL